MREELEQLRRYYGGHVPDLLGRRHEYAVLCPLVERPEGLHLLFEVRSTTVRQAGETCFPGGRMEPGEAPDACALRETEEELAIPPPRSSCWDREISFAASGAFCCGPCRGWCPPPDLPPCSPLPPR